MTKIPCVGPKVLAAPTPAWASPLGISSGHQVANDAKTGSGTAGKTRESGLFGRIGWGTWIRTRTNGVRVRGSTVNLFPKNSATACVVRCGRLIAKARADANTLFEKVFTRVPRVLGGGDRGRGQAVEKPIGESAGRCYLPVNETDGRLLHAMMALRGEMDRSDGPRGRRKAATGRGIG